MTTPTFDISVSRNLPAVDLRRPRRRRLRRRRARRRGARRADRQRRRYSVAGDPERPADVIDSGWRGAPELKVLCGGEAWPDQLAAEFLERCGSLWNMYGPTETTVWSAVAKIEAGQPVRIGARSPIPRSTSSTGAVNRFRSASRANSISAAPGWRAAISTATNSRASASCAIPIRARRERECIAPEISCAGMPTVRSNFSAAPIIR